MQTLTLSYRCTWRSNYDPRSSNAKKVQASLLCVLWQLISADFLFRSSVPRNFPCTEICLRYVITKSQSSDIEVGELLVKYIWVGSGTLDRHERPFPQRAEPK